tara:strand:+ start:3970 stop:4254 length:285 start_codon:yes stop_codon:yes gene_type:complete
MVSVFRKIALLEGLSYIILLFIGVPLKYVFNNDWVVKLLGMPHGILFIAYIIFSLILYKKMKWSNLNFIIILSASLIPFGTFYVDRKYLKNLKR